VKGESEDVKPSYFVLERAGLACLECKTMPSHRVASRLVLFCRTSCFRRGSNPTYRKYLQYGTVCYRLSAHRNRRMFKFISII